LGKEEKQIAGGIPFSLFIRGRRSSTLPSWSGKKIKKRKGHDFLNISHVLPDEKRQRRHGLYKIGSSASVVEKISNGRRRPYCTWRSRHTFLLMAAGPGIVERQEEDRVCRPPPCFIAYTYTPVVCVCVCVDMRAI
jgi:hypothetical protein